MIVYQCQSTLDMKIFFVKFVVIVSAIKFVLLSAKTVTKHFDDLHEMQILINQECILLHIYKLPLTKVLHLYKYDQVFV